MAITNCLNFGNPRKPGVFFQLREAIAGMGEACTALSTPVTGGNVSLYNESPTGAVYPTPVVGMVGLCESLDHVTHSTFETPGDIILLMGDTRNELGGSEYLAHVHGIVAGAPPACDLEHERKAIDALLEAISAGVINSAHDCSDGGLAVALAECCVANLRHQTGADVDITAFPSIPDRALYFGETQGRYVITSDSPALVEAIAGKHSVPIYQIGVVRERTAGFSLRAQGSSIESDVASLSSAWHDAIPSMMSAAAVATGAEAAMTVV